MNTTWDLSADVVIVGSGYAGLMAAIAAHDAGCSAVILEKMPRFGGVSILSAGGMTIADDVEAAFAYLQRTSMGTTPDDVLRVFAEGMVQMPAVIKELEAHQEPGVEPMRSQEDRGAKTTYPFPGREHIYSMKIRPNPDWDGYPWVHGLRAGARLYKLVHDNINHRRIPMHVNTPATRLLTDGERRVIGVEAEQRDDAGQAVRTLRIRAVGGVVLATGGFEFGEDLKLQYLWGQPVYGVAAPGNTGDGIKMAQQVGADLWHMWQIHGGYGFKFPEFPNAFRHPINGPRIDGKWMPWILVDRKGRRFMNEYEKANQDTGVRHLMHYDAETQDFPRIPCFMIIDENGRLNGPIGFPIYQDGLPDYKWSEDNQVEIDKGWIKKGESPADLAAQLGLPPAELEATLARWNALCDAGAGDADHARLGSTMRPLRKPPFYGIQCWPIVTNTQGGPVHDAGQHVLDPFRQPIPGLFAAGELGSLFGHLYLEGGNLTECFITGRIAGQNAAKAARDVQKQVGA